MKLYELMDVMHDGQSSISIWDGTMRYCSQYDDGLEWLKKESWYPEAAGKTVLSVATIVEEGEMAEVCIRLGEEEKEQLASRKDYSQAAERVLNALENCKAPVTWHEMDRPKILQAVARELRQIDQEGRQL